MSVESLVASLELAPAKEDFAIAVISRVGGILSERCHPHYPTALSVVDIRQVFLAGFDAVGQARSAWFEALILATAAGPGPYRLRVDPSTDPPPVPNYWRGLLSRPKSWISTPVVIRVKSREPLIRLLEPSL